MSDDYTPGHAFEDIAVVVPQVNHEYINACIVRLYKAGQANERAALVALLRAEGEDAKSKRYWDFADAFQRAAAVIERAS